MKKLLATIIALAMVLSLAACGGSKAPEAAAPAAPAATEEKKDEAPAAEEKTEEAAAPAEEAAAPAGATPNCNEDGSMNLDKIAHYDRNYDYTQNPKYKVAYLAQDSGPLYAMGAVAYEHWAGMFNCEWAGFVGTNGDSDLYLTTLQNMIDQGVTGFIMDPDSTIFPACTKIIDQYPEVQWMSQMSPPRDNATGEGVPMGGQLIHPYVGFDNYDSGLQQWLKLKEWKEKTYPDVDWSEVGVLAFDFSTSHALHVRPQAVQDAYIAEFGEDMAATNLFIADCVSTGINLQGGMDTASPIMSTQSFKYWLVAGIIDDWAQAAANIIDSMGLTDNSCVVDFGGAALQTQLDGGIHNAYRYALYTANNIYAEPIIGAVYAFLNGWCTPDTIWPSWINYNDMGIDGHTYPQLRLPTTWLDETNYRKYLCWTDVYCGSNVYGYDPEEEGVTADSFSPFVEEVPASYAKQ